MSGYRKIGYPIKIADTQLRVKSGGYLPNWTQKLSGALGNEDNIYSIFKQQEECCEAFANNCLFFFSVEEQN